MVTIFSTRCLCMQPRSIDFLWVPSIVARSCYLIYSSCLLISAANINSCCIPSHIRRSTSTSCLLFDDVLKTEQNGMFKIRLFNLKHKQAYRASICSTSQTLSAKRHLFEFPILLPPLLRFAQNRLEIVGNILVSAPRV